MERELMIALRRLVKTGFALAAQTGGVDARRRLARLHCSTPAVICHHRVMPESAVADGIMPPMLLSKHWFARQLDWLTRHYRMISLADLAEGTAIPNGKPPAAITFDDGYADVYEHAYPLLRERGVPATVFVITDLVGTPLPPLHDRLYVLLSAWWKRHRQPRRGLRLLIEHLGVQPAPSLNRKANALGAMRALFTNLPQAELVGLADALAERVDVADEVWGNFRLASWEMLREMAANGVTIGSHTRSHALLTNEPDDVVVEELLGSRRTLEMRLNRPARLLAYPDGRFDRRVVRAADAAGYRLAFTCCQHRDPDFPELTMPRKHIWQNCYLDPAGRFSPAIAACQVERLFEAFRPCRLEHGTEDAHAAGEALMAALGENEVER